MIKFFRHIRKSLLNEGKTSKYFKYAIGEIVLVVIGILIALQINNWNETRKDSNLEQTFLKKLKLNLQDDLERYKEVNTTNQETIEQLDSALTILQNHKKYNVKDLKKHLTFVMYFSRFNTNQIAFNNLMSIGKMSIIQNDSLTERLFLYYRRVKTVREANTESIDNYSRNTFGPAILKFDYLFSSSGFESSKSIENYADDPIIVNSLDFKKILLNFSITSNKEQIKKVESIIELINSELKND